LDKINKANKTLKHNLNQLKIEEKLKQHENAIVVHTSTYIRCFWTVQDAYEF